jgi:quinoprotein glucose dehydrogenase
MGQRRARYLILLGLAGLGLLAAAPDTRAPHTTWKDFGGGPDSSRYVDFTQITKANVAQMQVAWSYTTSDQEAYQFNPLIVDDTMYVLAKRNSLVALNAITGEEKWIHANLRGIARRGINYWESADRSDRRLLFQINNYLQAIDARTGKSILTFGKNGLVDLKEGLGRDPSTIARVQSGTPGRIFENLILIGSAPGEAYMSAPGHLRAFDVVSGKLVWTFHTIPQPGEFGYETWPKDAYRYVGGVNTWGEISVDEKRGIAYFPTGSPTYDYYGADRIGANLFSDCLLAIDARTGKRLWHFQTVHHDLWDYDLTAAPQLITVRRNGKTIDAVAQAAKTGFLFVFDRVTGEPLWPIEERPVPPSEMPGEQAWPTQPFPTKPAPFARQNVTPADLTPIFLSPEERTEWTERIKRARTGLFTPLSQTETIAQPGAVGGANWGNTAANPAKGIVYVMSQDFPSFYKLQPTPVLVGPPGGGQGGPGGAAGAAGGGAAAVGNASGAAQGPPSRGRTIYEQTCQACHGADRSGSPAGPSLTGVGTRLVFQDFRQLVLSGRGHMPAFPSIDDEAMTALWGYVGGPNASTTAAPVMPTGPVVASGGAPGGLDVRAGPRMGGGPGGAPYPEGVDVPAQRFYTGYGLSFPYILSAPWSRLVAYDLNAGDVKWTRPLGQDPEAIKAGGQDLGVPHGAQRMGMVVTSTGLLFATAKDGKVRAHDADTGEILWTGTLPQGAEGLPAMYQVNGRQYLVICATTRLSFGRNSKASGPGSQAGDAPATPGAYVVFALPDKTPTSKATASAK